MIACYFDMRLEDEPLSLVFELSACLVEYYRSLPDDILIRMATANLGRHRYYDRLRQSANQTELSLFGAWQLAEDLQAARMLFDGYFGLGQTMAVEGNDGGFWRLRSAIPEGMVFGDQPCPSCRGSKLDQDILRSFDRETDCNACAGSGLIATKQTGLSRQLADNLCLLFDVVRVLAYNCPEPVVNDRPMLMFLCTGNEGYGHQTVSGYYTRYLADYLEGVLAGQTAEDLADATSRQMYRVFNRLFYGSYTPRYYRLFEFPVRIESGNGCFGQEKLVFLVQVPGVNGCNVYTDSGPSMLYPPATEEQVLSLTCHNVDTPDQQIALIAGLAYLCGSCRAAESSRNL